MTHWGGGTLKTSWLYSLFTSLPVNSPARTGGAGAAPVQCSSACFLLVSTVLSTWPVWCSVSARLLCLGVWEPAAMTVLSEWSNTPTLWFPQHPAKNRLEALKGWDSAFEGLQLQRACSVTVYTVTPFRICQLTEQALPGPFRRRRGSVNVSEQHAVS